MEIPAIGVRSGVTDFAPFVCMQRLASSYLARKQGLLGSPPFTHNKDMPKYVYVPVYT